MSKATVSRAPRPMGVAEVISWSCVWLMTLCRSAMVADETVDFGKQIAPITEQHCVRCHSPGTAADRRTLIRHATYELIGLRPTPEHVEAFIKHHDPKAHEKLVHHRE